MFSGWEIPLIVLLALLFFGGKKLPELARGFGESIRTFKKELTKEEDTVAADTIKLAEKQDSDEQTKPVRSKKE